MIGVIEPGAAAAVAVAEGQTIGVIATEATVQSSAYSQAIAKLDTAAQVVEQACPLFVSLAEEGWADSPVAETVAAEYLSKFKKAKWGVGPGVALLSLNSVFSEPWEAMFPLIDSGVATASEVQSLLETQGLNRPAAANRNRERQLCDDLDHFYVTDAAQRFAKVAERFLGVTPSVLEAVEVWGQDELRTN